MFGRNKICWYSCCLTPSFPLSCPSQPIPRQHQPSFLFISAKFPPHQAHPRNPHTSFIPLVPYLIPPWYSTSLRVPLSATGMNYPQPIACQPPYLLRSATAVMAAVTESIKVVLMRLNCRRYCRPPPPLNPRITSSLPPSQPSRSDGTADSPATLHPFSTTDLSLSRFSTRPSASSLFLPRPVHPTPHDVLPPFWISSSSDSLPHPPATLNRANSNLSPPRRIHPFWNYT